MRYSCVSACSKMPCQYAASNSDVISRRRCNGSSLMCNHTRYSLHAVPYTLPFPLGCSHGCERCLFHHCDQDAPSDDATSSSAPSYVAYQVTRVVVDHGWPPQAEHTSPTGSCHSNRQKHNPKLPSEAGLERPNLERPNQSFTFRVQPPSCFRFHSIPRQAYQQRAYRKRMRT